MNDDDILSAEEAAVLMRVGIATLLKSARAGKIPCQRVGRAWRFSRAALLEWLHKKPEPGREANAPAPDPQPEPKPARKPRTPKQGQLV